MRGEVGVVIPAYHEERRIGTLVRELRSLGFPVIVVDDGSTDRTAGEAQEAGARVLRQPRNMGKGAALVRGTWKGAESGWVGAVWMDGDGQHLAAEVPDLVDAYRRTGADLLIGVRARPERTMPMARLATNRIMSRVCSWLARAHLTDSQSGFRVIRPSAFLHLPFRSFRFDFDSEVLIRMGRAGMRIEEHPVSTVYGEEISKIRPLPDTLRFLRLVFRFL